MSNIPILGEKKKTPQAVEEDIPWGIYVWMNPEGHVFGDDDGNIMHVFTTKGNREAIKNLTDAAKHHGAGEGKPVWQPGRRPISDEEEAEQKAREMFGLQADPLDLGALRDAAAARRA